MAGYTANPERVWRWYLQRRIDVLAAKPNAAHQAIAAMQNSGRNVTVVTQNVDDLHERAGNRNVIHLHGSLHEAYCERCARIYDLATIGETLPPCCLSCGASVRPGVVWFDETLPMPAWQNAATAMENCDLLIVVGTSALVRPASFLPLLALQQQASMLYINPDSGGELAQLADFRFYATAGVILPQLQQILTS